MIVNRESDNQLSATKKDGKKINTSIFTTIDLDCHEQNLVTILSMKQVFLSKTAKVFYAIALLLIIGYIGYQPIYYYKQQFDTTQFSNTPGDWGTFGDYIGGLLNPYISLLTLIVTAIIAYMLYSYEKARDTDDKHETDVKSFMELYQFFISPDFREVRVIAWYVLKNTVQHEKYKKFLLRENYVSRYIDRMPRPKVYEEFKDILYIEDHPHLKAPEEEKAFLRQESLDRDKVNVLVNFFQLLSFKNVPQDYYEICDFYYDTWRPVLYWYGQELENAYKMLEENQKYNNPPTLLNALKKT